ncbi:MAG: 8-oxoguanine deaminase [Spirochaetes bacterium]|nr:8-oxoguanine deaminase [Spirochaetota bacterium]
MTMILLKDCFHIVTGWNEKGLSGYDILIRGNRIDSIERGIVVHETRQDRTETVDARHLVAVPGLVNTHHHFYQTLTRNLPAVQNAALFQWLKYLYNVWKGLDEEAVYVSSLLAMGELLKTGCTLTTDHHYLYPQGFSSDLMGLQFEAAEKLGMRFSPCRGSMSLSQKDGGLPPDSVVQSEDEILKDSERVIARYHDSGELSMRRILLAPCSPFSVTEDLMKETAALARSHGVRLHTHLAETVDEENYCNKRYGKRPLALAADLDFIGPDTSYAHGVYFNDEELDMLADTGTSIAHCPSSNMRLGSGIARVRRMLDRNITVALAVDGSASNDTSDIRAEMRQAFLLGRVLYGPDAITVSDAYLMATQNGARLLGYEKLGRIKEGYGADIALFDVHRLDYAGSLSDPRAALVFCGSDHTAAYTIVNGRMAVKEGRLAGYDEEEIVEQANHAASRLLEKAEND